jgi:hypothetical protein
MFLSSLYPRVFVARATEFALLLNVGNSSARRSKYASASNGRSVFRQNDDGEDVDAANDPPPFVLLLIVVRFCLRFDGDSGTR